MSIYRLSSDAWEYILGYLEVPYVVKLLLIGNKVLQTRLKPAIRDFTISLATTKSPSLSSLLNHLNAICYKPLRLSISLRKWYYRLQFIEEDYTAEKWKRFIPETLDTLELAMRCTYPPFSSLLEHLASAAPQLRRLCIYSIPKKLSLPQSLTFLEIGFPESWPYGKVNLDIPMVIESLPTTLTHLKFQPFISLGSNIEASKLPFRNMPLTLFHGNITFTSLTKEQAKWSILPNTILDLCAELRYGEENEFFDFPCEPDSWRQLFPSLTRLKVPLKSLSEASMLNDSGITLGRQISEKKIKAVRSLFPASLTALETYSNDPGIVRYDVPLLVVALGHQLRSYQYGNCVFASAILKVLPRWENPRIILIKTVIDDIDDHSKTKEGGDSEKVFFEENPISRLCPSATRLHVGRLPASAIALLPKTITLLRFEAVVQEPISMASALNASKRVISSGVDVNIKVSDSNKTLGWTQTGWPRNLTHIRLEVPEGLPLHFECLPATLVKISILFRRSFKLEGGGDCSHMNELSEFAIQAEPKCNTHAINSLDNLPKSLRMFSAFSTRVPDVVFENPALQNFFFSLEHLVMTQFEYSADVLLHLPRSLTALAITMRQDGPCLNEKHFEGISRTKVANLSLEGSVIWPEDLSFNVLSRYLPKTVSFLELSLSDVEDKELEHQVAPHIPITILAFDSQNSLLNDLVQARLESK